MSYGKEEIDKMGENEKVKNLKVYAREGFKWLSCTIVGSSIGIAISVTILQLQTQAEIIATQKNTINYLHDQNEFFQQQNELLFQELGDINSQEYQNLSEDGKKKLDEFFNEMFQNLEQRREQPQEEKVKINRL